MLKRAKKKSVSLKNIQSLVPKNLNLNKLKVNPLNVIENTKSKIGNFYNNIKIEREKEKKRLEKKHKKDEKNEIKRKKKRRTKRKT